MYPSCLFINIQKNIVIIENNEVNTTIWPAKSPSAPICSAIVKDDTAPGAASIVIKVPNSIPLNPKATAIGKNIAGASISFPKTVNISCLACADIDLNSKLPPNIARAKGVATLDKSLAVLSNI